MSSSGDSSAISGTHVQVSNEMIPYIEDLKKTIEDLVWVRVMTTVEELASDQVLLHAMLWKEWHQLQKILSAESLINLRIHELNNWINEWERSVASAMHSVTWHRFPPQ